MSNLQSVVVAFAAIILGAALVVVDQIWLPHDQALTTTGVATMTAGVGWLLHHILA
jgi:hypothetical protein